MNNVLCCATALVLLCTDLGVAACAAPEHGDTDVGLQASAIVNGKLAGATDAPHTLLLRGGLITCTGIATHPHTS
jgi:hypothetical protein